MKYQLNKITVRDTAVSVKEAEARLEKPKLADGQPAYVDLLPKDIRTRLELFQPRRPGWGTHELDTNNVKRLAARIKRKGELDPVLVVNEAPLERDSTTGSSLLNQPSCLP